MCAGDVLLRPFVRRKEEKVSVLARKVYGFSIRTRKGPGDPHWSDHGSIGTRGTRDEIDRGEDPPRTRVVGNDGVG